MPLRVQLTRLFQKVMALARYHIPTSAHSEYLDRFNKHNKHTKQTPLHGKYWFKNMAIAG